MISAVTHRSEKAEVLCTNAKCEPYSSLLVEERVLFGR